MKKITVVLLFTVFFYGSAGAGLIAGKYKDNGDGTVTDTETNLQWMRCSLGQVWDGSACTGEAKVFNWNHALAAASSHHFAGKSDWRVPAIEELNTLVYCSSGKRNVWQPGKSGGACDDDYQQPTIHTDAFPDAPAEIFWSSTANANYRYAAWCLPFFNGSVSYDSRGARAMVRLVRAG
ncbi:uncharacterized protein DUF1566 [Desulfobotulus alkaliphilus]|uniref:Uncharacterized protein DUF1566 n=1 Tax=Desulfobotulus alkaliphilus TaxID=622671 RepID=A0A562RNX7_9BACT|nr:DUF1566 domain-containing protein [Desulfobotulus alkaliphilus]TWI70788.1 uncharacterized protein DUF1566 [Desulfobotulus alkaliphilus]